MKYLNAQNSIESLISENLSKSLDRLEEYFKKREEILKDNSLDATEKAWLLNQCKKECTSSFSVHSILQ